METTTIPFSDFALTLDAILIIIKRLLALSGGLVIFFGAIRAMGEYCKSHFNRDPAALDSLDAIRLRLGKNIVLGLEFIVASDVIETTTAPDYYSIGILAILVVIRTFLSYFLNRELSVVPISK